MRLPPPSPPIIIAHQLSFLEDKILKKKREVLEPSEHRKYQIAPQSQ
jgi:hypothetical protein